MSHFYLTLPSNSSHVYYPDNTPSNFKTKLLDVIDLDGDWEVGLYEIIFPRKWLNIDSEQYVVIRHFDCEGKPLFDCEYKEKVKLEAGVYTLDKLVNHINERIKHHYQILDVVDANDENYIMYNRNAPKLLYSFHLNKVTVSLVKGSYFEMSEKLAKILGFEEDERDFTNYDVEIETIGSVNRPDINTDLQCLFVYCDVLESVAVGDTRVKLLRIVKADDTSPNTSSVVLKVYEKPIYVPLQTKHFDTIEIDIRDVYGKKFPLVGGEVITTLHFRRAKQQYFL